MGEHHLQFGTTTLNGSLVSITIPMLPNKLQISNKPAKQRYNLSWILSHGPQATFPLLTARSCDFCSFLRAHVISHCPLPWSLPVTLSQLQTLAFFSYPTIHGTAPLVLVHDWLPLNIYAYLTFHCPVIHSEWANIDRPHMMCQTPRWYSGTERHRIWSLPLRSSVSWGR